MDSFRTAIDPLPHAGALSHDTPMMLLGSCFTTSVGDRLRRDGFDVTVNPLGTLYNPASVEATVTRIAIGREFEAGEILEADGLCHTLWSHTSLSRPTPAETLSVHNRALAEAREALGRCHTMIVTLGTAWVFTLRSTGMVVANCHKLPSETFERTCLSVEETTDSLRRLIGAARGLNPSLRFIFTVSPIRHAADGAHGNQLSKSTLLLAIDRIVACMPDSAAYFPSYEIMMDDLRDYRFYAADMRHPSEVAIDYIYSLFGQSYFNTATIGLARRCRALSARLAHRTIGSRTSEADEFAAKTAELARQLVEAYPCLRHNYTDLLQSPRI